MFSFDDTVDLLLQATCSGPFLTYSCVTPLCHWGTHCWLKSTEKWRVKYFIFGIRTLVMFRPVAVIESQYQLYLWWLQPQDTYIIMQTNIWSRTWPAEPGLLHFIRCWFD